MDDAYKMQEKNFDDLCEDIVNISRVLPNLTPLDLQTELLELRDDPDRVTTILKKHFKFYNEERENQMSQDIKMIKRVLPNMPIVQISKDLADVGQKKNRVQVVLKKYFTTTTTTPDEPDVVVVNASCKRSLDTTESLSSKILKLDDDDGNKTNVLALECTSDHLIPSNSPIDKINTESNNCFNINKLLSSTCKSQVKNNNKLNSNECVAETVSSTIETIEATVDERNLEMTSQDSSSLSNSLANEIVHSITEILSTNPNDEKTLGSSENCIDENTLFQIINSFYPDLTLEEMDVILSNLDINIYEPVDDATLNIALNEIMNYFENKEKFEPVETKNVNASMFVKTDTQSTESSSTEEYNIKDELTQFFQMPTSENVNTVKQESLPYNHYHQVDLPNYTDKNLGLLNKICREIEEDSKIILKNKVFVGKTETTCAPKTFAGIASGTDNWVKSALIQSKDKATTTTTITNIEPKITSTSEINTVKAENSRKRSVCSTVTSASIDIEPRVNPFASHLDDGPLTQQMRQENVLNYIDYGFNLSHRAQEVLSPSKRIRKPDNCTWSVTTNNQPVEKPVRSIERPPRDNLKSSLSNNFAYTAATTTAATYGKNFVQYLQNRNIDGLYLENEVNYIPIQHPLPYSISNQPLPKLNPNPNNNNNNNNLTEDNLVDMSRRSSLLTKKEEKEVKALLCEFGNGKCNTCKKCLKKTIALKVRNDLFRRNGATESSESPDSLDADNNKSNSPPPIPIPVIVDLSESSASNSNPLPGTSTALQPNENHPFFYKIMEMFPDICPDFLRTLCTGKDQTSKTLDYLISTLLEGNYDRRERQTSPAPALEFDEQYKTLLDLFPDADPTYLQHHCERLFEHPNEFKEFVASLLEHKNYPSKEDYLKKMKLSAQQKQYTTEFDVKKFLEVIPNPGEFFKNHNVKRNFVDQDYALTFLKNHYCHLTIKDINMIFRDCDHSVVKASVVLDKLKKSMKTKRRLYPLTNCLNIPLLQEIAYVKHKNEILNYMKMQEQERIENRECAKKAGLLKTCECCYDDEVMPEEMACCDSGHVFCKECVKKGCEVKIGEGKLDFPCLTTCEAQFSLQVLQSVLTPKVFSKMAQRKQLEEVKSAGIEDLEFCPFCDFATIPAPGDKLFRCLNTDCMKESCRECKEPSHIPLRCDEVEKENDVKLRTYIEDKMTEALVRKCYKCGMKFIKEEGCNKMTCSCGAMMCYVCNQPVKDYKHFNGQGGDQFHLCPLYSDTHKLHMDAVKLSAENAKKELGIANNQLKIDPTANLDQHYKRLANRNPQNLPPGMEQLNPQHIHIRIQEFHLARR